MGAAAIIALLSSLVPLVPSFVTEIQGIIGTIKHHGEVTPLAASQIHELAVKIHQQVVDEENKRLAPKE